MVTSRFIFSVAMVLARVSSQHISHSPAPPGQCFYDNATGPASYVGSNLWGDATTVNHTDGGPEACCAMCHQYADVGCLFWQYDSIGCYGSTVGCCRLKTASAWGGRAVGAATTTTSGSIDPLPVAPVAAKKYLLTDAAKNQGAVCLDGSPGAYYFQPGTGDGSNKWYIHHEGGGWCESLDDCASRSTGGLGSSLDYPDFSDLGGGYFDTNNNSNPLMYNWNHVFMRYCDGASFSGNNETTVTHEGTTLYWRGHRVREAMEADLFNNRGMAKASDLVVSGCSAGGLATYLHTDQWCDRLKSHNPSAKCSGLPDSGFFLDYEDPTVQCTPDSATHSAEDMLGATINGDYHCGLKWTYTIQNATAGVNQDCLQQHTTASGEDWKCMFAEHTSEHIRWPVFAMQSQYDSWQTGHVQGIGGDAKTQELGDNITARVQSMLMGHNEESGAFLDSCHHHCGSWNGIRIDGDLISTAHQKWYNSLGQAGSKKLWNQNKPYPCADCCHP